MKGQYVRWTEPGPYGRELIKLMTIQDATAVQLRIAHEMGHGYHADKDALNDFIQSHWADIVEVELL